MSDRFSRTRLMIGDEGLEKLRRAHVAVVGCGAVGSFAIEALARAGVGRLTLIDYDTVDESNINRQLFALFSTLGQQKTAVAKARVADISPDTIVTARDICVDGQVCETIFADAPDFVIDAIDDVSAKVALAGYLQSVSIPFAASMGAALRTRPADVRVGKMSQTSVCPLAATLRQKLKKAGVAMDFTCVYSVEKPVLVRAKGHQLGSLPTVTGIFGLTLANEAIRFLLEQKKSS